MLIISEHAQYMLSKKSKQLSSYVYLISNVLSEIFSANDMQIAVSRNY